MLFWTFANRTNLFGQLLTDAWYKTPFPLPPKNMCKCNSLAANDLCWTKQVSIMMPCMTTQLHQVLSSTPCWAFYQKSCNSAPLCPSSTHAPKTLRRSFFISFQLDFCSSTQITNCSFPLAYQMAYSLFHFVRDRPDISWFLGRRYPRVHQAISDSMDC